MAIDAEEYSSRYSRVIPNSQSFGSLDNIVVHYDLQPEEITKEYLLLAFKNTLERGLDLVWDNTNTLPKPFYFTSVKNIIGHLEAQVRFDVDDFVETINNTICNGYYLKETKQIKTKMKKKKVYSRVDGELYYQELKWVVRREANGTPDESKPPAEWISYMQQHINDANKGVYNLDDEEALAQVRKVVALGVRCLMIHGCPEREIPNELLYREKE